MTQHPEELFISIISKCKWKVIDGITYYSLGEEPKFESISDLTVLEAYRLMAEVEDGENGKFLWVSKKIWFMLKSRFNLSDQQVEDMLKKLMEVDVVGYMPY